MNHSLKLHVISYVKNSFLYWPVRLAVLDIPPLTTFSHSNQLPTPAASPTHPTATAAAPPKSPDPPAHGLAANTPPRIPLRPAPGCCESTTAWHRAARPCR